MLQVDRNRIEIGIIQKMIDVLKQFFSKFKGVKIFQKIKTNELTKEAPFYLSSVETVSYCGFRRLFKPAGVQLALF